MEDKEIFDMWTKYSDLLKSTKRTNINNVVDWLFKSSFATDPASTQYHNCFKGGLLKHSLDVYYHMHDFQNMIDLFELPEDTIIITALLHDICKVGCYQVDYRNVKNDKGEWTKVPFYKWEEDEPLGHGAKSVMLINELGVQLTKVERAMIVNHMGWNDTEDSRRVTKLFNNCPQCMILYFADMVSTFVTENTSLPDKFRQKLVDTNITVSLKKLQQPKTVTISGMTYELASPEDVVDNKKVIIVSDAATLKNYKVYAPYKDGLPF